MFSLLKRKYKYHFKSHADGGCKREEAYLRESNGIILEGKGCIPWFTDGQYFDKEKFHLCPPGKEFTFVYHTKYTEETFNSKGVHHTYKAVLEGDRIKIVWLRHGQEFNSPLLPYIYTLFKVPKNWKYTPAPKSGFTNGTIFMDELKIGESTVLDINITQK